MENLSPARLLARYRAVRGRTVALASPLSAEDQCVQSMPDASPTKWHLGHTSWFFETIVLQAFVPGYAVWDARLSYLFNSYYEALGPRHPRPHRGLLTRPTLAQVHAYRQHVDDAMAALIDSLNQQPQAAALDLMLPLIDLGLNHEEQHQELLLTDLLHLFSCNPLLPAYDANPPPVTQPQSPAHARGPDGRPVDLATAETLRWLDFAGGLVELGVAVAAEPPAATPAIAAIGGASTLQGRSTRPIRPATRTIQLPS